MKNYIILLFVLMIGISGYTQDTNEVVSNDTTIITNELVEDSIYPKPYYKDGVLQKNITEDNEPPIVGKRRYSIPLDIIKAGWEPNMIIADVENKAKVYQPLKDAKIKINFAENVAICRDNHTRKFKYSSVKEV